MKQFRLRTLLIVVVFVGAGLGIASPYLRWLFRPAPRFVVTSNRNDACVVVDGIDYAASTVEFPLEFVMKDTSAYRRDPWAPLPSSQGQFDKERIVFSYFGVPPHEFTFTRCVKGSSKGGAIFTIKGSQIRGGANNNLVMYVTLE